MELSHPKAISNFQDGKIIKLRSIIQDIPINPSDLSLKLELQSNLLKFKGEYLNKYRLNSSFSPILSSRKDLCKHKAIEIQKKNENKMKKKLQRRYEEEIKRVDEEVKVITCKFDNFQLKDSFKKMNKEALKRRFDLDLYKYKAEKLDMDKLRRLAKSELLKGEVNQMKKQKELNQKKVKHRRSSITVPDIQINSFLTEINTFISK
ncbi:unnamed protein product [Blepharisma stoltei]|uniref:Uncharacterized protein n=1 Tax=Blepharisma stoltei TaxID=1481888 RepID=A0AAU9J465_9CILI|nr:unnamed protein product [Blepharisma stoltei]